MKKVLALVAAVGIVSAATVVSAATIVNSKHDLSNGSTNSLYNTGSTTQICVFCHAPHNANLSLPLWNRTNPTSTFILYQGQNMANQSFSNNFTADSTSLFCMSCHDGVTSISAVHNAGVIESNAATASAKVHTAKVGAFYNGAIGNTGGNLGTDLSKTHPINFRVTNDNQADLNYASPATFMGPVAAATATATGVASGVTYPLFKSSGNGGNRVSASDYLECGSCHAVHDSLNSPFLRETMAKSTLCLGCHNK